MTQLFKKYIATFKGLSPEVWWLSLITFVNRSGAMVLPFLSLYLKEDLIFTKPMIGWVMTAFGFGSLAGSWIGGKLVDAIGYYKTILISLVLTGVNFLWVMHISSFEGICFAFFILICLADIGRPGFFVALNAYAKPENKTRSLTLLRLAINLGMGAGPALGGMIITAMGYQALFYIDGFTCLLAAILMVIVLNPRSTKEVDSVKPVSNPLPPHKDNVYLLFLVSFSLFGIVFIQLFSLIPVFFREVYALSEQTIGYLLGLNGLLIVVFEMPLIAWIEAKKITNIKNIIFGLLLTGLSYIVLLINPWFGALLIMIILITFGEMIVFPFSNKLAYDRAKLGKQGAYMGLYTMSFAIAHIFGHNGGMQLTAKFGYNFTWCILALITCIAIIILLYIKQKHKTA